MNRNWLSDSSVRNLDTVTRRVLGDGGADPDFRGNRVEHPPGMLAVLEEPVTKTVDRVEVRTLLLGEANTVIEISIVGKLDGGTFKIDGGNNISMSASAATMSAEIQSVTGVEPDKVWAWVGRWIIVMPPTYQYPVGGFAIDDSGIGGTDTEVIMEETYYLPADVPFQTKVRPGFPLQGQKFTAGRVVRIELTGGHLGWCFYPLDGCPEYIENTGNLGFSLGYEF